MGCKFTSITNTASISTKDKTIDCHQTKMKDCNTTQNKCNMDFLVTKLDAIQKIMGVTKSSLLG